MASRLPAVSGAGPSQPHSVETITRMAQDYEYNASIPLRYWLRSAATLFREARVYEREGHDEQAYLLLFRHAQLILVNLAKHTESKDEDNRKALVEAEKEVKKGIEKMETLRPRINKRFELFSRLGRHHRHSQQPHRASRDGTSVPGRMPADPALTGVAEPLEAGENRDLAVRLARDEIGRRATARRATWKAGISREEEESRRVAGFWDGTCSSHNIAIPETENDVSKHIQKVGRNIDRPRHTSNDFSAPQSKRATPVQSPALSLAAGHYKYPSVPRQKPLDKPASPPIVPRGDAARETERPAIPPKEPQQPMSLGFDSPRPPPPPPPRPSKEPPAVPSAPPLPDKIKPEKEKDTTRTGLDPSSYTFKPSAYLENGTPLRSVFISSEVRRRFLSLAAANTRRNLETCGILCGTLISNALFVSRLLIPEQTATSDTCETVNESAIFDYCESEDLMVLGWIHTHPTQTCFMSSRDLHTHCGYQVMLPESIAIVCAPSKRPDWGIFRLTDPPGLRTVLGCKQTGLFHPHSESNIYTDALRPGHVYEVSGLEFEVVDLRPGA